MTMTKKDYELIEGVLSSIRRGNRTIEEDAVLDRTIALMASALELAGYKFDRQKFVDGCKRA